MRKTVILGLVAPAVAASPALARDRYGYQAIAAGDFASAERSLDAERRIFPDRPELLLNLAAVYRHTDRTPQARDLYRQVLASDSVALALSNGQEALSHDLARAGLSSLDGPQFATR